jgi:hypothetical protein
MNCVADLGLYFFDGSNLALEGCKPISHRAIIRFYLRNRSQKPFVIIRNYQTTLA